MIGLIHINSHREQTLNSLIYRFCLITLKVVFDAILNSISSRSSRRDRKQTSVRQYEQGAVRTFLHSYIWTWSQAFSRLIGWNVSIADVRCDHGFHGCYVSSPGASFISDHHSNTNKTSNGQEMFLQFFTQRFLPKWRFYWGLKTHRDWRETQPTSIMDTVTFNKSAVFSPPTPGVTW